jgi:hypothetical protein
MKSLQDAGIDNVFFWINPVEKWQQRKSDVMTSFGHTLLAVNNIFLREIINFRF